MNKLSKREKNMLIMLAVIGIIGLLFMFVVKPIIDTASSNKAIIADLKIQTQEAEVAVAMKPIIEKRLADATEFIDNESQTYYAPMFNWEAERRVIKWLYDNKVVYHSISTTNPRTFQLPPVDGKQIDPSVAIPKNGVEETKVVVECHTNPAEFHNMLNTLYLLKQKGVIATWEYEGMEYKVAEGVEPPANAPTIKALVTFKLFTTVE